MFESGFMSPEQEAILAPDECWAIVWRAFSCHVPDKQAENPFVAEYFLRMLSAISDMRAAGEILADALPDGEVPLVAFKEVMDQGMASVEIVADDERRAGFQIELSLGIDAVEDALSRAFAEHKTRPLPSEFSTEYL